MLAFVSFAAAIYLNYLPNTGSQFDITQKIRLMRIFCSLKRPNLMEIRRFCWCFLHRHVSISDVVLVGGLGLMALLPTQVAAQAAGVPDAGCLRQQIEQPR
jgi:hypothetical protein